jgi:predicted ATP-grasp superfamily ATP-dependent carboligase
VFTSPFGVVMNIPKLIRNEQKMEALPMIPTQAFGMRLFAMPFIKKPSNGNNGINPINFNIILIAE